MQVSLNRTSVRDGGESFDVFKLYVVRKGQVDGRDFDIAGSDKLEEGVAAAIDQMQNWSAATKPPAMSEPT
jgi:hypothetical protein